MLKNKNFGIILLLCVVFDSAAGQLSDPTKPATISTKIEQTKDNVVAEKPRYILKAITITASSRIAIINDQAYQVGHRVGDEKIIKIFSNKVTLSSGKELVLFDQSVVSTSLRIK